MRNPLLTSSTTLVLLGLVALLGASCSDDAGAPGVSANNANNINNEGDGGNNIDGQNDVDDQNNDDQPDVDTEPDVEPDAPVCDCAEDEICRNDICIAAICSDPDVGCPDGRVCVNDVCLLACDNQTTCGDQACVDGACQDCTGAEDCGEGLVCQDAACVANCNGAPQSCNNDQACEPDTGLCIERCLDDLSCDNDQICNRGVGLCEPQQCSLEGEQGECEARELCFNRRCIGPNQVFADFCAGCEQMSSSRFSAVAIVSPVGLVGDKARSDNHILEAGVIRILSDGE